MESVVTIEDAIEKDQFFELPPLNISNIRTKEGKIVPIDFSRKENDVFTVSGLVKIGGQEHFYLETQNCVVIPEETNELRIISSTQHLGPLQLDVSKVMKLPLHKIVASVRRLGGGFGGKETASTILATMCSIAAVKLHKPVRCSLERCDDMIITGTRHPFRGDYTTSFTSDGKLLSFDSDLYSNAGAVVDLSSGVMERAVCHIDNVYKFDHIVSRGHCCKTNFQPSTGFRGFGAPQGMFITESMIDAVAETLGISCEQVRERNFYEEGDKSAIGITLEQCNIRRCWEECKILARFAQKRDEVNQFNQMNKSKKRGLSMIPTKFGIAFGLKSNNQAGALVHIYLDGTVLISHAGIEMGQGLHTKCHQIACRVLGVPIELVHIHDTSTNKVPNASGTAASTGSDLNGMAIKNACETLVKRLQPYKDANPNAKWTELVNEAYLNCVSLSTTGYWAMPKIDQYDFATGENIPYLYHVYGTAYSLVEIDCLTGDHKVLEVSIVMDVGDSLNPAIDIGQIEGAFIQGYGLFTMEELKSSPTGNIYTRGPGTYKIPSADDIPRNFDVKLLKGSSNKEAIFSSKAIGEPPLFLGSAVFFAIKDAIKSARDDNGYSRLFEMNSPATPENIRICCQDKIMQLIPEIPSEMKKKLWLTSL